MVLMAFLARMTRSGEMKTTRTRTRQPHTCASMDWYSSSSPSSLHIGWRWEKRMSGRINLRIAFPSHLILSVIMSCTLERESVNLVHPSKYRTPLVWSDSI